MTNPTVITLEIWFKTTVAGGKLIDFDNTQTGLSASYDRHLYMTDTGRIVFGVYPGAAKTIAGPLAYNDGAWQSSICGSDTLTLFFGTIPRNS
ncbi:hypothetical protein IV498_09645 [Paenarthrobacter sp. Z7-10]|uniref:hypothetical protein n=1 Tax=Paenarthrobacter sp. Z7-10 TaxID=2787635 RepID=UPI0022A9E17B|nr:hypothetical protein [Paenarthrobacter sp. Z7-10]MCZ2403438.1 hypothetical protein [Paenarthrobacter sp. Z7-10]